MLRDLSNEESNPLEVKNEILYESKLQDFLKMLLPEHTLKIKIQQIFAISYCFTKIQQKS